MVRGRLVPDPWVRLPDRPVALCAAGAFPASGKSARRIIGASSAPEAVGEAGLLQVDGELVWHVRQDQAGARTCCYPALRPQQAGKAEGVPERQAGQLDNQAGGRIFAEQALDGVGELSGRVQVKLPGDG